ncbi:uncharacterized protein SCODWIG_00046 [Saccharomycodes ludwigii]|uniref:Trafficking protein particle complex III-specific subunit 85 n=1 Tax=Saccharomycodes ludwigii TaxID=36035 RepID=A0A376B0S3_9ASCO|nr:uncharacterized protein SCODWIG_00046 [Saccharomycodes ludwigii]
MVTVPGSSLQNITNNNNIIMSDRDSKLTKQLISDSVAPVVTIVSSDNLDAHLSKSFIGISSMYDLLLKYGNHKYTRVADDSLSGAKDTKINKTKYELDDLFTLRFAPNIKELLKFKDSADDLTKQVKSIITNPSSNQSNIAYFHEFFQDGTKSMELNNPLTTFNHPIVALLCIDTTTTPIDQEQHSIDNYDYARDLLVEFKNIKKKTTKLMNYINVNDILPVFLLCYNDNDRSSFETASKLAKTLKKQLFVESLLFPIWKTVEHNTNAQCINLSENSDILNNITIQMYNLKTQLMTPFMYRKIQYWQESILNSRKSLQRFFFKKFAKATAQTSSSNSPTVMAAEEEFLLRKMADWCFILKDFKLAYICYDQLIKDFNPTKMSSILPKIFKAQYLQASHLIWSTISIFMGAQTIITGKMIKSDIDPNIQKAIDLVVPNCEHTSSSGGRTARDEIFEIVLHFLLPISELFLTLSDEWLGVPYSIKWYERILQISNGKYFLIECFIWERLSYCYDLRVDPKVVQHVKLLNLSGDDNSNTGVILSKNNNDSVCNDLNPNKLNWGNDLVIKGHHRKRKANFFKLLAAKKWAQCGELEQTKRLILQVDKEYKDLAFAQRNTLLLYKLKKQVGLVS